MATKRKPKKERTTERKLDGHYTAALNRLIDRLFEVAAKKQWTWEKMAEESGLSSSTIHNLGGRVTRWPQYRTVELLARALGGRIDFVKAQEGKQPRPTFTLNKTTLKLFSGRRKRKTAKAA